MASGARTGASVKIPRPPAEREEEQAQQALLQRPAVSIRTRIVGAFVLLFVLMCAITACAVALVSDTHDKLIFLEKATNYLFEVQQARRFEKNFFLYGTNLTDALSNVHTAVSELDRNAAQFSSVLGKQRLAAMKEGLEAYAGLLDRLVVAVDTSRPPDTARRELESQLRKAGARTLADAEEMLDSERLDVHARLHSSTLGAFGFLALMFVIMALVAAFLSHTLLTPLDRFLAYTERIGAGNYSPIQPVRRYRDEFSDLAVAINRMLHELRLRQEELIQAAKMAGVGTLTAGIAHELNNPLNNIALTTEALVDGYDEYPDAEKLRMLGQVATQVERASATVRNLLDFTRREPPVVTSITVREFVGAAVKLVGNELALAHVDLHLAIPDDLPTIRGNLRNLQQVFVNLLLNAIQAMPQGGELSVGARADSERFVRIDVRDTGVGIEPENLDKVFDPFFTTKEPGMGTGLGLTVSYAIVEKHGGRITVASRVGEGTTFSVFLPFTVVPPNDHEHLEKA